jgi:NAD(P)-dependent dehydrogenase (short-subunit alcohol dehydrogenase family)
MGRVGGELAEKVAIVTGAGGLIGRGIALGFLREGARVLIADRNAETANETRALAEDEGFGDASFVFCGDVTEENDVASMISVAVERFGRLDVMINNAGGPGAMEPLLDIEVDSFDRTFAMLVRSVFLGIKHAGRQFRAQSSGGVILSTASASAHLGGVSPALYSSAKAAVICLTAMAAVELGTYRIRVNSVSPGAIWGPGFAYMGFTQETLAQEQAWPIVGTPDDVAAAMVFLAGDRCQYATGADFQVDGGMVAKGSTLFQRMIAGAR